MKNQMLSVRLSVDERKRLDDLSHTAGMTPSALPAQFDPRKFFIRRLFTESRRRILPSAHCTGRAGLY